MGVIHYLSAVVACLNLGSSLGSTRDQSSSGERLGFFDAELFQELNEKHSGNLVVSPMSIKLVLGMLMEGAEGETAEEIRAVLRFPHHAEARRKEFNTWLSKLQVNDSSSVFKMANGVFMSDRFTPGTDYENTLRSYYSAGITGVRFEDSTEATRVINDWVGNRTSHLIPTMMEEAQMQADYKVLVASAVYFKGLWSQPFASDRSAVRCFYPRDNVCKDSVMMTETGNFNYGYISRLEAKAVVLPYKGGRFSMLLLLPSKRESVERLGRDLVHVSLNSILSEIREQEVLVQIPKFEIAHNEDLVETLSKLGVSKVFDHGANLSKMFDNHPDSISVGKIYHSAKITVDEEGSEAAGATGALFVPLMGGTTTSFVANRPFLFFVLSSTENLVLFAGKVVSPRMSRSSIESTPEEASPQRLPTPLHAYIASDEPTRQIGIPEKAKHVTRSHSAGPKFRSIKPFFSAQRGNDASFPTKYTTSYIHPRLHGNLTSQQVLLQKETQTQTREKTVPEQPETRKRPKPPSTDDWRHRVLFFT